MKSRLPGGFAAQKLWGTGRRKCAIARVVVQEGSGNIIINARDATVRDLCLLDIFCVNYLYDLYVLRFVWLILMALPLIVARIYPIGLNLRLIVDHFNLECLFRESTVEVLDSFSSPIY